MTTAVRTTTQLPGLEMYDMRIGWRRGSIPFNIPVVQRGTGGRPWTGRDRAR